MKHLRAGLTVSLQIGLLVAALSSLVGCRYGSVCTDGETRCASDHEIEGCISVWPDEIGPSRPHEEWRPSEVCDAAASCVAVPEAGATCVVGGRTYPLCDQALAYCDGDVLVQCAHGFAVSHKPCGSDTPGGSPSTHCIASMTLGATCIPPESAVDPICANVSGPTCDDAALVECVEGFAVFRVNCRTCAVVANTAPCSGCAAHQGQCTGFLGDKCRADADCANGLQCHTDSTGVAHCSAPCTVNAAGTGKDCAQWTGSHGLPLSTYAEIPLAQRDRYPTLNCLAGFCAWSPYGD